MNNGTSHCLGLDSPEEETVGVSTAQRRDGAATKRVLRMALKKRMFCVHVTLSWRADTA